VFYRDYMEKYITRTIDFQSDTKDLESELDAVKVGGGGDYPEAVFEAFYAGLTQFSWQAERRVLILVGNAPPHKIPRGSVTKEMVIDLANKDNIELHSIMLPKNSP